ncbi:hypothetical protein FSP39_005486 [Pinctada imbricata]|uniref:Uncharacterized protein n=1 Tax=Pinctada imbricata TaxID=66713 RepID=A0AA88YWM7_PINIB|nr:hypothetical protein FSP39_005486 [Pinctada imbricata]
MKVTEHWREASLSCGDSITSLKELLRQPAENDDVTDNLTMTEVGGNSNSLTLYRDSNIEQEEAEDENFIKRTDFQEKETEWIGGLPHKDRLRKESDKALSLGSTSVFSLADLDPLLEKEKPFSSGKLTSHDTRNLLVRYIQKILNIMMSSVLKKIFIIVYENGPCYFSQKGKPMPPLAQKPGMKELPSDETEGSAKISEGSVKSLEECTTEIDENQDLESAGGSDPKVIIDVEELLSGVDAALERSQDIASQTTRMMDKMQVIVDEWNVSVREFYGEKERKFRCEETLCLKDKPSLRHFHAEVFPVKESVTG